MDSVGPLCGPTRFVGQCQRKQVQALLSAKQIRHAHLAGTRPGFARLKQCLLHDAGSANGERTQAQLADRRQQTRFTAGPPSGIELWTRHSMPAGRPQNGFAFAFAFAEPLRKLARQSETCAQADKKRGIR